MEEDEISRYTKKPVTTEAVVWDGSEEVISWVADRTIKTDFSQTNPSLFIETLEGTMEAKIGDYIIQGVKGELYPCKPDIFKATYTNEDGTEI